MYRISNIYVLAAFGTIGGALFGFDVRYEFLASSLSYLRVCINASAVL